MTGLEIEKGDVIMEIACLVTDGNLNVLGEGIDLVISVTDEQLNNMNEWCVKHHGESGLTEKCRNSKISLAQAEQTVLEYISKYTIERKNPLAGNSIHNDKLFLRKYMPKFDQYLHYRIIDVSSIKELTMRWYPNIFSKQPSKKGEHRALDDIIESIEELKWYKQNVFRDKDINL